MEDEKETFSVEVERARGDKSGYYIRKRTVVIVAVAVVLLIILVGIVAAFLGPGKRKHSPVHGSSNQGEVNASLIISSKSYNINTTLERD